MKLKDKVALVTGSAQGIGKAIAQELTKEGAKVIISDVNIDLANQTAGELNSKAYKLNVADLAEVESVAKEIASEFGKIDILVNNAGITRDTLLIRMKSEDWDKVIAINLTGTFNLCKTISPLMMKQRTGKIINIASIVGLMGNFGQANYAASKAGVIGLTKTLARELATRNITVNAIAPGFIDTEMTRKIPEEIQNKMKEQIPLARFGLPEDVAKAVVFLASSDADYITGQVISVNGGMLM